MGFFDLQVNGYAGVDFNGDGLDAERVDEVCARLASEAKVPVLFVGKPFAAGDSYWEQFRQLVDNKYVRHQPHVASEQEMIGLLQRARAGSSSTAASRTGASRRMKRTPTPTSLHTRRRRHESAVLSPDAICPCPRRSADSNPAIA